MMIKRIYMENLFSHRKTEIEFDRGLTAIVGPNGAGKSSIIEAIFLALFDSGSQISQEILRTGRSKKGIVRVGAGGAIVALDFEAGGRVYRVRREYDAYGSSKIHVLSEIRDGRETILARGVSDVTKYISKILGTEDPRVFTSTIFSRQDMLSQILDISPSERKSKILSLLGLKDLEEARDLVRKAAGKAEEILGELRSDERKLEGLRKAFDEDRKRKRDLEAELGLETKKIGELEAKRNEISSWLGALEKLLSILREVEMLERAEKEARELEKEIGEIDARLGLLKSSGLDLDSVRRLRASYRIDCVEREEQLRKRIREYGDIINKIRLEISSDSVKKGLEEAGIDPESRPEDILARLEEMASSMERRLGEVRGSVDMYRKIMDLRPEGNRCPFCGRDLDPGSIGHILETHKHEIQRLESEERRIESAIKKLRAIRSRLEKSLEKLREYSAKLEENLREVGDVEKCASQARELCSSLISRLRSIGYEGILEAGCHRILEAVEEELTGLIKGKEVLEKRLGEARALYNEARLKGLRRDAEAILENNKWLREGTSYNDLKILLERERDKIQGDIESLRTRIGVIRGNLEAIERNMREREQEIKEIEERVRKKPSIENSLKILRILEEKILGGEGLIAQMMIQMVVKSLEEEVNRSLSAFSRDFTVEIESDFNINIRTGSGGLLTINNLSGGERTMLAIAFRIALAKLLLGRLPSVMILDEPTQNLDVENKSRLFDIVREIAGFLDQVIVVTHDEEIMEKADRIVRVEIENGASRAQIQIPGI